MEDINYIKQLNCKKILNKLSTGKPPVKWFCSKEFYKDEFGGPYSPADTVMLDNNFDARKSKVLGFLSHLLVVEWDTPETSDPYYLNGIVICHPIASQNSFLSLENRLREIRGYNWLFLEGIKTIKIYSLEKDEHCEMNVIQPIKDVIEYLNNIKDIVLPHINDRDLMQSFLQSVESFRDVVFDLIIKDLSPYVS